MSRLDELIEKLCPDGVEYKTLGKIALMKRGTSITKKNVSEGSYPVVSGGREPAYYCAMFNRQGETITVAGSGAGAGYVQYWDTPIFVCDAFSVKGTSLISTKFLYYLLTNKQEAIYSTKKGGGVPHVHISDIENFRIPVPPLEVQAEIVRILDNFTELEKELEKELELRRKQYEYYRDLLLDFRDVHAGGTNAYSVPWLADMLHELCPDGVEYRKLAEIFNTKNGYTPSKVNKDYWNNGTVPWFRMEDIRENGTILNHAIQNVSENAIKGSLFPADSIIVATSATIGQHALIKVPSIANQRFTYLMVKEDFKEQFDVKFLYYYCFKLDEYCKECLNQGNFAAVDMKKFAKFEFSIPPLSVQQRIVDILDRFDALCNDISSGLPAEIALRRKQYEYYRDKLLNFKELKEA